MESCCVIRFPQICLNHPYFEVSPLFVPTKQDGRPQIDRTGLCRLLLTRYSSSPPSSSIRTPEEHVHRCAPDVGSRSSLDRTSRIVRRIPYNGLSSSRRPAQTA